MIRLIPHLNCFTCIRESGANAKQGSGESNRDARDQKVILMLLMVSLSFIVLCLPNGILHILFIR